MSLWPFPRAVASVVNSEAQKPSTRLDEQNRFTKPDQIARVLEQLLEHRCLLTVSLPGVEDKYISAVIEVVRTENYVVIDELAPRAVNAHVQPRLSLTVRARMNNVTIRFHTTVADIGEEAGIAYYRLPFPMFIDHLQRREHYRAGVPMEKRVPVQLAMPNGTLYSAEVRDVSMGGLSARLPGALPFEISPGNAIQHLVITLPNSARIHGSGQVCYADLVQSSRVSRCGIRFMHIDRMDQHALELFIAQLDREMKRKRIA